MEKTINFKTFLGIDVSKKTLDYHLTDDKSKKILAGKTSNDSKGIDEILQALKSKKVDKNSLIICYEYTGVYIMNLNIILSKLEYNLWVVPAYEIKLSKGMIREKSDKNDAKCIALYAMAQKHKFKQYILPEDDILKLKLLQKERHKITECIKRLGSTIENYNFYPEPIIEPLCEPNQAVIDLLKESLMKIEKEISRIINSNEKLKKQRKLIKSIPGVGDVTALYFIIVTNGFTKFENSRKMACYAGVAPFENSSGTSLKGKKRVSHLADKKLKSLLHMCAMSSLRSDIEIKTYYNRKKDEGKHTNLVFNNIKQKIISRVFAVINREQPFVKTMKWTSKN